MEDSDEGVIRGLQVCWYCLIMVRGCQKGNFVIEIYLIGIIFLLK